MTDRDRQIDDYLASRGARRIESPIPVSQRMAVALSLAAQLREDETLSEQEKNQMAMTLPRNRAEARRYLKGRGPWGLAKRG